MVFSRGHGIATGLPLPVALCAAMIAGAAQADSSPYLTGNWDGLRDHLIAAGVHPRADYVGEPAYNASGGDEQAIRYADQLALGATLDLQKLLGWAGGSFQITVTDRNGRSLSKDAQLHDLQQVQEVYGRGQTWRLTQMWLDQRFGGGWDWKLGRLPLDDDFASYGCDFMNLTFCGAQPGNLRGDYWFNWPVSQWGTRLKWTIANQIYVEAAAYQTNPNYLALRYSINPDNPGGTTGALYPVEAAWLPRFGADQLDGSYKLGAWYSTAASPDVYYDINYQPAAVTGAAPLIDNDSKGIYLNFMQRLTRAGGADSLRGLKLFLNATKADRSTSDTDYQIALSLVDTGPCPHRPADDLGLALGTTHVNSRVADGQEQAQEANVSQSPVQTSEYVSEIYYSWHVMGWLVLRPNLQYVLHPGGSSAYSNEAVIGMKLLLAL